MSNQSSNSSAPSTACPFSEQLLKVNHDAGLAISILGIVANTICIVVFARIVHYEKPNTGHMFKYLLCKAIHDDVQFISQIFAGLYYCTTCPTYQSYSSQVWYIWFYYYLESVNELCAGFFEVAATFDCLITINRRMLVCRKNLVFALVTASITTFAFSFYIFWIFEFNIVKISDGTGARDYFVYEYTAFAGSSVSKSLHVMHGVLRDVITLVLLVILNVLILETIRRQMAKKKALAKAQTTKPLDGHSTAANSNHSGSSPIILILVTASPQTEKADRAEAKATTMVVAIGVNYTLGHVLVLVQYCFLIEASVLKTCVTQLAPLPFYISYVTPLFLYFLFNKTFKSHTLALLSFLFFCFRK